PLPLTGLQDGDSLGNPLCTRLGPFRILDPANEIFAIEGRQGLEVATCSRLTVQGSSDVLSHGAELRTFGCQQNDHLCAHSDGCVATPRRSELEDVSACARGQLAANLVAV